VTDPATLGSHLAAVVTGCARERLAEVIAALEVARVHAWLRLATSQPAAPTVPPDRLVGAKEMARLLDLPEHWVRDHARRKLIPSLKVGHYVVFDPPAVIAAVRALGGPCAQDHPSCDHPIRKPHGSGG
jgi:hypothetical protein